MAIRVLYERIKIRWILGKKTTIFADRYQADPGMPAGSAVKEKRLEKC